MSAAKSSKSTRGRSATGAVRKKEEKRVEPASELPDEADAPMGAAAGALAGAAELGLSHSAGDPFDFSEEDAYWRQEFQHRPYARNATYADFAPAFRYGWEATNRYAGQSFEEFEAELESNWEHERGTSRLSWEQARDAVFDAWNKVVNLVHHE